MRTQDTNTGQEYGKPTTWINGYSTRLLEAAYTMRLIASKLNVGEGQDARVTVIGEVALVKDSVLAITTFFRIQLTNRWIMKRVWIVNVVNGDWIEV